MIVVAQQLAPAVDDSLILAPFEHHTCVTFEETIRSILVDKERIFALNLMANAYFTQNNVWQGVNEHGRTCTSLRMLVKYALVVDVGIER